MLEGTADKIFKLKYSQPGESWEDACLRISEHIANAEKTYGATDEDVALLISKYYDLIYNLVFVPGGRVIANAGTGIKNLNNCYFLPIEDSRSGIYQTLKDAAEIFAWGGGVGYNFSDIREEGAPIKTTGGQASGPLSFMSLFDQTGEVIQQASRRGAQMGLLNVDHPDIEKFIDFKSVPNSRNERLLEEYDRNLRQRVNGQLKSTKYYDVLQQTLLDDQLTHFNISVVLTDEFMSTTRKADDIFNLISRVSGQSIKAIHAKKLLERMATQAWKSGDPGVFFVDRVNEDNMVPYIGSINGTNPCLVGSTRIMTFDGPKTFKELADAGTDVIIYSWDKNTKLPVLKTMRNPRMTRENAELVEVKFDNGLSVKCTPDHNFYSFVGEKVEAQKLKIGQSVRAFSMSEHRDGHYRVHGWVDGRTVHQYVSRLLWEFHYGKIPVGMIVHHKDDNEKNNVISNLELITALEHNKRHYQHRLENGFFYNQTREQALARNHKVLSVTKLEERQDVYNGVVDDTHSYIILDDEPKAGIYSGIVSANCGEVPLLPYEPCTLGSLNLVKFYNEDDNSINFEGLEYATRLATRFLDDVQEVSYTPLDQVNLYSKGLRRIGLGTMGWADLLAELELPYDSEDAFKLGEYLSWFITFFSWLESVDLAEKRGAFPMFEEDKVDRTVLARTFTSKFVTNKFDWEHMKVRNVSVTSIAPTGSIALIAGVNSSIEPFFALAYKRHITQGVGNIATDTVIEINPILFKKLKKYGLTDKEIEDVKKKVLKTGSVQGIDEIPDKLKAVFRTSREIRWQDHVTMQAAWQSYVTNAVSKTINMPKESTVEDVEQAYMMMWDKNLKGGTVYRESSKAFEILNAGTK